MPHKLFSDFPFKAFSEKLSKDDAIKVATAIKMFRKFLDQSDEIRFFLENNNMPLEARKRIVLECVNGVESGMPDLGLVILFYLLETGLFSRLAYFMNVLRVYLAQERNLMLVDVISRYDLGEGNLRVYESSMEYMYHKDVGFMFRNDPKVLGGFILSWHSGEIDLTVRRKVNKIKELISQER